MEVSSCSDAVRSNSVAASDATRRSCADLPSRAAAHRSAAASFGWLRSGSVGIPGVRVDDVLRIVFIVGTGGGDIRN